MRRTHLDRQISAGSSRRNFLKKAAGSTLALMSRSVATARPRGSTGARKTIQCRTHDVAKIPAGYQVAVADVNGDGRLDILGLSSAKNIVEWYENPDWTPHPITTSTRHNISLAPFFHPNSPIRGLALASDFALDDSTHGGNLWWVQPATDWNQEWHLQPLGTLATSHRLRWGKLDGRHWALVDVPLLGFGATAPNYSVPAPLTWFEMPKALVHSGHPASQQLPAWTPRLIDNSLTVVHGINIVDWDGDGRDEVLTASFEGVHIFHSSGHGADLKWTRTHLAEGDQKSGVKRGSSEIGVGRVSGKRFLATIEPWHGDQVVVYPEGPQGQLWTRHVIDSSFHDGHALACADFDGDGNDEIVAGFRGSGTSLYVYCATDGSWQNWERQLLDADMGASGVVVADISTGTAERTLCPSVLQPGM